MTGFDLDTWIALRRVSAGRVTKRGQRWLENGHPVPDLSASLVTLCQRGLVTLAERSPLGRAAALTRAGAAHYDLLCQRALGLSAARFDASCRWFGLDDPSEAAPMTPVSALVAGGPPPHTYGTGRPHLRDVEDTPIPLHARVVQVTVDEEHGALPSRLHQRGEVVGRGPHLLHVCFEEDEDTVALRPDLVRVLNTGGA